MNTKTIGAMTALARTNALDPAVWAPKDALASELVGGRLR
jgi:hypothetical protein